MTPAQQSALEALIRRPLTADEIAHAEDRNDALLAATLIVTTIVKREVGDGLISLALGTPEGPVFLLQLETIANLPITDQTDQATTERIATARQAWRSINRAGFDVGDPGVREGIDSFVGSLLIAEQATAIKALAAVESSIPLDQVSAILNSEAA